MANSYTLQDFTGLAAYTLGGQLRMSSLPAYLAPLVSSTTTSYETFANIPLGPQPYESHGLPHAPLLLLLRPIFLSLGDNFTVLFYAMFDFATAAALRAVARSATKDSKKPNWVDLVYFLHPFAILSTQAKSTIVFNNFFIALSLYFAAVKKNALLAGVCISFATHLSLYPVLLVPFLGQMSSMPALIGSAAIHQVGLLLFSFAYTHSWAFLSSVYGATLGFVDLSPNIGLGWYFFAEMFDHFRPFFLGVFQLHVLIYMVPLWLHFRSEPLLGATMMLGVIAIFKSYPTLGDFALWHALVFMFPDLLRNLKRPVVFACLTLYSLALLPTFYHLWIAAGTGNANFFYASTLVWALSQGGFWLDLLQTHSRRKFYNQLTKEEQSKVDNGDAAICQY